MNHLRSRVFLIVFAVLLCAASFSLGLYASYRPTPETRNPILSPGGIREALSTRDRLAQALALAPPLRGMGPGEVDAVSDAFEASFDSGGDRGLPLEFFVEALAGLDPLRALDRILGWPEERRKEAFPVLLQKWARSDPASAVEILNTIEEPELRRGGFTALIEGWAASGDDGVWRYLAELRPGMEREGGISMVVRERIMRRGPDATLQEIEELPEEAAMASFRVHALRSAVGTLARSDPARATAVAEAHRDDPGGGLLMRRVAVNWVTQDPTAAMAWIREQPATSQRDRVLREAYRRWVVRDGEAAVAWMRERGAAGDLHPLFDMYATALARSDPRAAITWLGEIEDPALRSEALADVADVWYHEDPEAARPWLEKVGLYDAVLEREKRRAARFQAAVGNSPEVD